MSSKDLARNICFIKMINGFERVQLKNVIEILNIKQRNRQTLVKTNHGNQ